MTLWKKRKFEDYSIDFETLEEIIEELIFESFNAEELDFTKPLHIGFTLSVDDNGKPRINEFGILKQELQSEVKKTEEEPLFEIIESGEEFLVAIEVNDHVKNDLTIKVLDTSIVVSSNKSKDFLKKITFPKKISRKSLRTSYNNGIIELRVRKKTDAENAKLVQEKK